MIIINSPRQGGKTRYLVDLLKHNPTAILFVIDSATKDQVVATYHVSDDAKRRLFTHSDLIRQVEVLGLDHDRVALIDDVEFLLQRLFAGHVGFVTVTSSVTNLNPYPVNRQQRNASGQLYALPP